MVSKIVSLGQGLPGENTAVLTHCREQRAMLASQREALASQRIPIDSTAELRTSPRNYIPHRQISRTGFFTLI